MPVYVIGQMDIHDPDNYKAYVDDFMPSFTRHGGQLLALSSGETHVLEGEWATPKTVIMRFPDRASAQAWYDDPEYRELAKIRHRTARTNIAIVEGLDAPIPEN